MPRFTAALTPRFIPPHEVTPETFDVMVPVATATARDVRSAHAKLANAIDDAVGTLPVGSARGCVLVQDDAIVATLAVVQSPPDKRRSGVGRSRRGAAHRGRPAKRPPGAR